QAGMMASGDQLSFAEPDSCLQQKYSRSPFRVTTNRILPIRIILHTAPQGLGSGPCFLTERNLMCGRFNVSARPEIGGSAHLSSLTRRRFTKVSEAPQL